MRIIVTMIVVLTLPFCYYIIIRHQVRYWKSFSDGHKALVIVIGILYTILLIFALISEFKDPVWSTFFHCG